MAADSKAHQQGWRISNKNMWGGRQVTSDDTPADDQQRVWDGGGACQSSWQYLSQGGGVGEEGAGDQAYSWLEDGRWSRTGPR